MAPSTTLSSDIHHNFDVVVGKQSAKYSSEARTPRNLLQRLNEKVREDEKDEQRSALKELTSILASRRGFGVSDPRDMILLILEILNYVADNEISERIPRLASWAPDQNSTCTGRYRIKDLL
jgi:hypothetical protein